jgi:mono/diheme cytochrome c family protein
MVLEVLAGNDCGRSVHVPLDQMASKGIAGPDRRLEIDLVTEPQITERRTRKGLGSEIHPARGMAITGTVESHDGETHSRDRETGSDREHFRQISAVLDCASRSAMSRSRRVSDPSFFPHQTGEQTRSPWTILHISMGLAVHFAPMQNTALPFARRCCGLATSLAVILASAGALATTGCGGEAPPAPAVAAAPAQAYVLGGNPQLGRKSFVTICANCHGENADGKGEIATMLKPAPPDLHDPAAQNLSDQNLVKLITEGGPSVGLSPTMGGVGVFLSDDQIRDIAAYVRTLAKPGSKAAG